MQKQRLNKQSYLEIKREIDEQCGWLASLAAIEVVEKALAHSLKSSYAMVNEVNYVVLVLEADCHHHAPKKRLPETSLLDKLCRQGLVVYYYHSIDGHHHHICLALKKKIANFPILAHG